MFVRWRQRPYRLSARLVQNERVEGKVRQRHVAELGSIAGDDIADRRAFWRSAAAALARLDNRLDAAQQGAIRGALHARVPMVTPDELASLSLDAAERAAALWRHQVEAGRRIIADRLELIRGQQQQLATDHEVVKADAERAAVAESRLARARAGEPTDPDIGLTSKQYREMLAKQGITPRQARRWRQSAALTDAEFEAALTVRRTKYGKPL